MARRRSTCLRSHSTAKPGRPRRASARTPLPAWVVANIRDAARRTAPAHTCTRIQCTFSPLTRSKTTQAPKLVLPESAAGAPEAPRTSCVRRPRRRGGGRERWHQLAAARPHVGEAVPQTRPSAPAGFGKRAAGRGGVSANRRRSACRARRRRVVEPQGAARAVQGSEPSSSHTLLIQPQNFSRCRESRAHRTFVAVPRPDRVSSSPQP